MAETKPTSVIVPPQTPDEKRAEKQDIAKWRLILVLGAIAFVLLTVGFQIWASLQTSKTTVNTTGTDATTRNGKVVTDERNGPPDTLVATCAGAAAALLAAAAFYGRLKKFSFGGAVLEFTAAGELTKPEEEAVVKAASTQADDEGLQAVKPEIVANALLTAKGAKVMARNGVTPESPRDDVSWTNTELLLDPDALANYSAVRAIHKFKNE